MKTELSVYQKVVCRKQHSSCNDDGWSCTQCSRK